MDNQVTQWLLESSIPTIRYKTLLDLKNLPSDHPDCQKEYQNIQQTGAVPAILEQQVAPGRWKYSHQYYTPKFTSTHWSMLLLEELKCDPQEPRFQAAVEAMLFLTQKGVNDYNLNHNPGFTCLWGNIIRYCVYGQKLNDPRLQTMIELTAKSLHNERCKCDWNYQLPCVWGAARSVWGLLAIPQKERLPIVEDAILKGIEFILENITLIIDQQTSLVEKQTHPTWYKINFPIFYQTDILFVLRLVDELNLLGYPKVQKALQWLHSKQKKNETWHGTSPFRKRTYAEVGDKEETNRWVTLIASTILNNARNYA